LNNNKNNEIDFFEIFPWDINFETGINLIDEQHKQLVDILNRLAAHLANLSSVTALDKIFDELADYTDYHFKCEEGIWSKYFNEDKWFIEHEKTHGSFIGDVLTLKRNKENKPFDDVIYDIVIFLSKWLAFHILDTDKRMAKTVLKIESGLSLLDAKEEATTDMSGSMQTHIETVLSMYSSISTRTLDLMREKALRIKAEKDLHISEERWKFILDSGTENIWDWDIQSDTLISSEKDINIIDIMNNELKEDKKEFSIHPADIEQVKVDFQEHLDGITEFYSNKHRILKKDGSWIWILSRGKVVSRGKDGEPLRIIGTHTDITERELASLIYKNSSQSMFVSDSNNNIISVNPAFTTVTGYTKNEVIGKNPKILASGKQTENFYRDMWDMIKSNGYWDGELLNKRKNGEIYSQELKVNSVADTNGVIDHYVALFSDISEKKKSEEIIIKQANFDSLTQLQNRRMFKLRLEQEIERSSRSNTSFAVFFIDLDHFKDVNDSLGHDIGDNLLIEASLRIKKSLRESDIIARFGGDEFTIILPEVKQTLGVDNIAEKIITLLSKPFILGEDTIYLSASIGITLYPNDAKSGSELLTNADQAMYEAKKMGRSRFHYFTPSMQEMAQKRKILLADLHGALELRQFEMYYQPIVDLKTGDIFKAEALIRWNHHNDGQVSPVNFIPLAEQSGLIVNIGDWVYKESAKQVEKWIKKYETDFKVSINMSPTQFKNMLSLDDWIEYLKLSGLTGSNIVIEITESLLMEDKQLITDKLLRFQDEGIEISLDDFGTGYSSLSYLKKMNIDYLKIDKSFIDNLTLNSSEMALCEAMVVMAHKLDIKVVAEGIETQDQKDLLFKMDCDYGQGYYFSKPISSEEFEKKFLEKMK
jgi:diguanylate cyclase (GGDEF)-like protein/hemerythrin-like metal-binding protein/PAS domain S-box-containing protein